MVCDTWIVVIQLILDITARKFETHSFLTPVHDLVPGGEPVRQAGPDNEISKGELPFESPPDV